MADKLQVAIVGCGAVADKRHIPGFARLKKDVVIQAVCDKNEELAKKIALKYNIPNVFTSQAEMLAAEKLDIIDICTPPQIHAPIAVEALEHGCHVLLEKPMALEARQAWELVGIAKSRELCLQVGHILRFNNALKLMRDLVAQEYLGNLYYLKLQWTTLMPSPLNRDIIFDLGPHPVDILNYLLRKWPTKVACKARAYRRKTLEELAYMTMEFDNHLMAHIELSWLQPGKIREATIIGSERSAVVDCVEQSVRIYENGDGESFGLDVKPNNTILDETGHFAESILGKENSNNPGPIGARNVAVLEKLKESMEQEKTMKVIFRDRA